MRTLVHLSDLHFGRTDPAVLGPLVERVNQLQPHVVVVSGDLTQRARSQEFIAARRFLDALPRPQIVVPGNHDVPLYDVLSRFGKPLRKYRRYISADLEPAYIDDEIAVVGVNTARSLTVKQGRISREQIERVRERCAALAPGVLKVIVTHHPFDLPAGFERRQLVGRAALAMKAFAEVGADLLLAGHFHLSQSTRTSERHPLPGYAALAVQAGTATSTRARGETNSFNVLHAEPGRLCIERHAWDPDAGRFELAATERFVRNAQAWVGAA